MNSVNKDEFNEFLKNANIFPSTVNGMSLHNGEDSWESLLSEFQ
jgi:hypothetical protein